MGKPGLDILIGLRPFRIRKEAKQLEDKRWKLRPHYQIPGSIEVVISEIEENSRETERLNWKTSYRFFKDMKKKSSG